MKRLVLAGIVSFYVLFSVVSLVAAFLLSATAPSARGLGATFESCVANMEPLLEEMLTAIKACCWSQRDCKNIWRPRRLPLP